MAHAAFEDELGVLGVVADNALHFGEMPSVPLLDAHGVRVDFLVEFVQESHRLNDHGVDLIGGKLEFVSPQGMGQAQLHGPNVRPRHPAAVVAVGFLEEFVHVSPDAAEEFVGFGIVHDAEAGDGILETGRQGLVGHGETGFVFFELFLDKALEGFAYLSLHAGRGGRDGVGRVGKGLKRHEVEELGGLLGVREEGIVHVVRVRLG